MLRNKEKTRKKHWMRFAAAVLALAAAVQCFCPEVFYQDVFSLEHQSEESVQEELKEDPKDGSKEDSKEERKEEPNEESEEDSEESEEEEEPCCGKEEHTHSDACFEIVEVPQARVQVCTLEMHAHMPECWTEEKVCVCGKDESEEHTHTQECFELQKRLTCTLTEHEHQEGCFVDQPAHIEKKLVCTREEHKHDEKCLDDSALREQGYFCRKPEHKHSEENGCYNEDGSLRCILKEHEHTPECKSDKKADLEKEEDWLKTLPEVSSDEPLADRILRVAQSQLGYAESKANFIMEGEKKLGYTRYGQWYGVPYGDWCAMFASFCLYYAGAEDYPLESYVPYWIDDLKEAGLFLRMTAAFPEPGDLLFIENDPYEEEEDGDHVGIVTGVRLNTDGSGSIFTIEGNRSDRVMEMEYSIFDPQIIGFGCVSERKREQLTREEGWTYWKKVTSESELTTEKDYLLVEEGGLALGVNYSGHSASAVANPAKLYEVPGEDGLYRSRLSERFEWNIDSNGTRVRLTNVGAFLNEKNTPVLLQLGPDADCIDDDGNAVFGTVNTLSLQKNGQWTLSRKQEGGVYSLSLERNRFQSGRKKCSLTIYQEVPCPIIETEEAVPKSSSAQPSDVVFCLDTAYWGIGTARKVLTEESAYTLAALNTALKEVLAQDPQNRVGVVVFSASSAEVLALDHYSCSEEDLLQLTHNDHGYLTLSASDSVRDSSGKKVNTFFAGFDRKGKVTDGTRPASETNGIYTQAGITQAVSLFCRTADADAQDESTVLRQPVFVLMTGHPATFASSDTSGIVPGSLRGRIGSGRLEAGEMKNGPYAHGFAGKYGYYCVQTACWAKQHVSERYGIQAQFNTIGLVQKEQKETDDRLRYLRAVLDPSESNLKALDPAGDTFSSHFLRVIQNDPQYRNDPSSFDYSDQCCWVYPQSPSLAKVLSGAAGVQEDHCISEEENE